MAEKPRGNRKQAVAGLEHHQGKWRWRPMREGKRVTIPLVATNEADAVVEVLRMKNKPLAISADEWATAVGRYLSAGAGAGKLSASTVATREIVLTALGRDLRLKSPRGLTAKVVQRWVDMLQARPDLSTGSVRDYVAHLRGFTKWAVLTGRLSADPVAEVVLPKVDQNLREVFVEAPEVARLLAAARDAGDRDMEWIIALGCECGMRRGEIAACRAEWFDLARGTVTIPVVDKAVTKEGTEEEWKRKGQAGRRRAATVPLSAVMKEMIRHHGLPSPFVVAPKKTTWGKNRYRFEFRKRFRKFMAGLGCGEVTIHDLRRSFGSNRVSAGVSLEKVANWMGIHRNTAWIRYARFIPADEEINKGSAAVKEEAAPVTAPATSVDDVAARLAKVEQLFTAAVITEEERQAKRAEILRDL